jgi:hypothetical protein
VIKKGSIGQGGIVADGRRDEPFWRYVNVFMMLSCSNKWQVVSSGGLFG